MVRAADPWPGASACVGIRNSPSGRVAFIRASKAQPGSGFVAPLLIARGDGALEQYRWRATAFMQARNYADAGPVQVHVE